jgi:hypothetical protein
MTPTITPSQRKAILDLWDSKTKDTSDIAQIVLGSRRFEPVIYNLLATMSGDAESCHKARHSA